MGTNTRIQRRFFGLPAGNGRVYSLSLRGGSSSSSLSKSGKARRDFLTGGDCTFVSSAGTSSMTIVAAVSGAAAGSPPVVGGVMGVGPGAGASMLAVSGRGGVAGV